jgi:hypothetical protein
VLTVTRAPGNGAPIGGLRVVTAGGWFAARPSGTEDMYKIYAESFRGAAHLDALLSEAHGLVDAAIGDRVILSDGDVVFHRRKVERSGISEAGDGHVLIYIHKEETLDDVERRYPARHYVLDDDKPQMLAAVKGAWGDRVTTIFPRQGRYARDAIVYRAADLTVERIGDLLSHDLSRLVSLEVLR